MSIRFVTAGESHGRGLLVILEGIPAGLNINAEDIDVELVRRQKGFGRGQRMKIETDTIKILSGMRHARSLGSPIALYIENKDWDNWKGTMSPVSVDLDGKVLLKPRPGHADLAGLMKYGVSDFRDILERASARETAARVAAGTVCKGLLKEFGINNFSYICISRPCPTAARACFSGRLDGVRPSFPAPAPTAPELTRISSRPALCRSESSRTKSSIFSRSIFPVG